VTDAELRALVRASVARHLAQPTGTPPHVPVMFVAPQVPPQQDASWQRHTSHHLYVSLVNVDEACVIEPTVPCDHCGYCKSHGD
jgi:hypothetical protein